MSIEKSGEAADPPESPWFRRSNRPTTGQLQEQDLVLLVTLDHKRYVLKLQHGNRLHTHLGIYEHNDLIGSTLGSAATSLLGHPGLLLEPSLSDLIKHMKRATQIIYPKDAAYLVQRLNLRAGCRVVEAGTGSGGLTTVLAWSVAPTGKVYTYEARPEVYQVARRNLERVALLPYVEMIQASIDHGFGQTDVDALVLDVREPWRYLRAVRATLRPGGFFASLLPTTNQVTKLLVEMEKEGFVDVAVEELLLRSYKPVPERLRPNDVMVGHTGFLTFARPLVGDLDTQKWQPKERQRYRARKQMEAQLAEEQEKRDRRARDGLDDVSGEGGRKYPRLPLPG